MLHNKERLKRYREFAEVKCLMWGKRVKDVNRDEMLATIGCLMKAEKRRQNEPLKMAGHKAE